MTLTEKITEVQNNIKAKEEPIIERLDIWNILEWMNNDATTQYTLEDKTNAIVELMQGLAESKENIKKAKANMISYENY